MQWTHPGGPWFAPRPIRRQALDTCGQIFPEGHTTRKLVNYMFRALHPYKMSATLIFYAGKLCCCKRNRDKLE